MKVITPNSLADIEFKLSWRNHGVHHVDCYFAERVNFGRDYLPDKLFRALMDKSEEDEVQVTFQADEIIPPYEQENICSVPREYFNCYFVPGKVTEPRKGRFYPRGIVPGVKGIFKEDMTPCRCVELEDISLKMDFNHPLAYQKEFKLFTKVFEVKNKSYEERWERCTDWPKMITAKGVGFQTRWQTVPTDFFSDDPFGRMDWMDDTAFYSQPRFVSHIDAKAIEVINSVYEQLLKPGMDVLDLMSSWASHLPSSIPLGKVIGLGLNQEELVHNPQLTSYVIHDVNKIPHLPFASESFDAVICTVSVEYLTQPFAIFEEVARLLKSEGHFIVSFSNRWFPPKVVRIWLELHEFERMGLVLEYFLKSKQYKNLETYSVRNFPRPKEDKYIDQTTLSDPVFVVWGQKA